MNLICGVFCVFTTGVSVGMGHITGLTLLTAVFGLLNLMAAWEGKK